MEVHQDHLASQDLLDKLEQQVNLVIQVSEHQGLRAYQVLLDLLDSLDLMALLGQLGSLEILANLDLELLERRVHLDLLVQ